MTVSIAEYDFCIIHAAVIRQIYVKRINYIIHMKILTSVILCGIMNTQNLYVYYILSYGF